MSINHDPSCTIYDGMRCTCGFTARDNPPSDRAETRESSRSGTRDPRDVLAAWDGWKVGGPHAPDAIDLAAALRETLAENERLRRSEAVDERFFNRAIELAKAAEAERDQLRKDVHALEDREAALRETLAKSEKRKHPHDVQKLVNRRYDPRFAEEHVAELTIALRETLAENERLRVKRERQTEHERKRLHDEQNAHAEIYDELLAAADALHAENLQLRSQLAESQLVASTLNTRGADLETKLARAEAVVRAVRATLESPIVMSGMQMGKSHFAQTWHALRDAIAAYDQGDKS